MEKNYYIKYKDMYLKSISTNIDYPNNNFISHVEFSMNNYYCDTFTEKHAELLRDKLDNIGFGLNITYLEEVKEEEED